MKKLLKEYIVDPTAKFSEEDVSVILDFLKGTLQFPDLIYRGVSTLPNSGYDIRNIRQDRILKDTSEIVNALINGYVYSIGKQNILPDRKSCVFATVSRGIARYYSRYTTVIFPSNSCTIQYSTGVEDSFDVTKIYNDDNLFISNMHEQFHARYITFISDLKLKYKFNEIVSVSQLYDMSDNNESSSAVYYNNLRQVYELAKNIDYSKLQNEISQLNSMRDEILEKYHDDNNIKVILTVYQGISEFIDKYDEYIKNIHTVTNSLPNHNEELIISGDKYMCLDYFKFINTFTWNNNSKSWVPINDKN